MSPATGAAPIESLEPIQIILELPALAAGTGLTVTVIEFELVQPVAVIVSVKVYVVVIVGETEGLERVDVNPEGDETQA